ncbi:MAG: hypothetical protein H0Z29_12135 [Candidatus Marinimicrobia bacterium]|nr:hypothetical protein [Candidatus Neomarinimicrobiota bacterium]
MLRLMRFMFITSILSVSMLMGGDKLINVHISAEPRQSIITEDFRPEFYNSNIGVFIKPGFFKEIGFCADIVILRWASYYLYNFEEVYLDDSQTVGETSRPYKHSLAGWSLGAGYSGSAFGFKSFYLTLSLLIAASESPNEFTIYKGKKPETVYCPVLRIGSGIWKDLLYWSIQNVYIPDAGIFPCFMIELRKWLF